MAYIYRKKVGKKTYYYLRVSQRDGKRMITKDIAYLGNDLSKIDDKIHNLGQEYKKEIRTGHRNIKRFVDSNYYLEKVGKLKKNPYFDTDILRKVEAIKLHFTTHFNKHHHKTQEEVYQHFLIDFAYNTTSIEGNTITLEEAYKLLQHDLTPKERTTREIFDLQNTQKVFFYLLEKKPLFSEKLIIKIHDMLLDNIDIRKGYRDKDIKVFKSHFKATPGQYVKIDVGILFQWYNKHKKKLHPLVLATLFHHKLEKIHPFFDGNGRTGRLVMIYLLLINKYPPLIIQKKNRSEYLNALSLADKSDLNEIDEKFFKDLVEYVSQELIESYWNNFNI